MDKKILILLIALFSFVARGQIFTDNFSTFAPDTLTGTFFFCMDTILLDSWGYTGAGDNTTDIINNYDFSATGSFTEPTGSFFTKTGMHTDFDGNEDYLSNASGDLNPGTGDFTIQAWVKTPAAINTNKFIANKREGPPQTALGWQLDVFDDDFRALIINDAVVPAASVAASGNNFFYVWAKWDRSGNCVLAVHSSGSVVYDTVDISGLSAVNLNPSNNYVVGAYTKDVQTFEWDGGVIGVKWNTALTPDKMLREDNFLAENWKSGGGDVYRNAFGWAQGVLNTGGNPISVGLKGGTQSAISTITGDSARYTVQFSGISSLSSDSLIIVAGGDSVWHSLPDSTFPTNYRLQVVIDVWQLGRLSAPIGNYAYCDNITVSTYQIFPEISVNPESYAYGNINVGDSSSTTIQVRNTGAGLLTVTDITPVTEAQINVSPTSFTVSTNDSQAVTVYFKPQSAGALVDTLTIANDDADEGSLEVPLSATGVAVATTPIVSEFTKFSVGRGKFKGW